MFHSDNVATTLALKKGVSGDPLTTAVIRAARVVSAGIDCQIFSEWERRRSSTPSRIADDLTHNIFTKLNAREISVVLEIGCVSFPPPILSWMSLPHVDLDLGSDCLAWIRENNLPFSMLYPKF